MSLMDMVFLIIVGIGALLGGVNGFFRQLAGLLGLAVGLLAAKALYGVVAERVFSHMIANPTLAQIAAFIAIWVVVPIACLLLATVLTKAMSALSLGWVNTFLGVLLGAATYALLLSVGIGVMEFVDPENAIIELSAKNDSRFYYPLRDVAGLFLPAAKEITEQIYNELNDASKQL